MQLHDMLSDTSLNAATRCVTIGDTGTSRAQDDH